MACGQPDQLTAAAREWYATHGFQPTFYYEAIWNVVGFVVLWTLARRLAGWLRDGDVFFLYLIWYPFGRFWIEMLRPDAWRLGALATAQWVSLGAIAIALVALYVNHHRPQPPSSQPAGEHRLSPSRTVRTAAGTSSHFLHFPFTTT